MQIKGYPIRLPLDVALVFSANPEDYTARGKIITPLKDRIGSEIRTHYPATVEEGIAITAQEAWTRRNGHTMHLPNYVQESDRAGRLCAREDKKIDKRSGVSQRLPISAMENVISNAERRAIRNDEKLVVPRISDVYAALPAITGKLELEYEGEMKGADYVGARTDPHRRSPRPTTSISPARTSSRSCNGSIWVARFRSSDSVSGGEALENLKGIQGLIDKLGAARRVAEGSCANSRFRRPNSSSKDCTRTSASAAAKSACSKPGRRSRRRSGKNRSRQKSARTGREGSLTESASALERSEHAGVNLL